MAMIHYTSSSYWHIEKKKRQKGTGITINVLSYLLRVFSMSCWRTLEKNGYGYVTMAMTRNIQKKKKRQKGTGFERLLYFSSFMYTEKNGYGYDTMANKECQLTKIEQIKIVEMAQKNRIFQ